MAQVDLAIFNLRNHQIKIFVNISAYTVVVQVS